MSAYRIRIAGLAGAAALSVVAVLGVASFANESAVTDAGAANTKAAGISLPDKLSPQWRETTVAQGSTPLENPSALTSWYGYFNDGPMVPAPGAVQATGHNVEATKSEPDKITYLVVKGQHGADPTYDYGTHFLYQGHELDTAAGDYITRINLDADAAHRVTKLAETEADGKTPVPEIDGSTWDPFAQRLLFTTEGGPSGGVVEATLDYPSKVSNLWGVLGQGGFEGVQNDQYGNVYLVEDTGGSAGTVNKNSKQPNSFIYRLLPYDPANLDNGGKLQVLQVASIEHPGAILFNAGKADADILSADTRDLHTYGHAFKTLWVTVHDTKTDGTVAFDANAAAKKAGGTPFKRPENGQFKPGAGFTRFYFAETGDTTLASEAGADYGGFGGIQELQQDPKSDKGTLRLFYQSDKAHSSFDNVTFFDRTHMILVQDQGDGLHSSLNALDSAFMFDVNQDYASGQQPVKVIAEGRDPSATIDSAIGAISGNGFNNEGDNEITGIHESNGDPTSDGLLGAAIPRGLSHGWRLFFTHQHGDNVTSEVIPA
ncbi:MAG: hypothetical protein QOI71_698 [Gaiellales bacterium]|nr:hypothetical protein [Gaiellales bacterium]